MTGQRIIYSNNPFCSLANFLNACENAQKGTADKVKREAIKLFRFISVKVYELTTKFHTTPDILESFTVLFVLLAWCLPYIQKYKAIFRFLNYSSLRLSESNGLFIASIVHSFTCLRACSVG